MERLETHINEKVNNEYDSDLEYENTSSDTNPLGLSHEPIKISNKNVSFVPSNHKI